LAISRARKEELVEQYVDLLGQSRAVFLAEYTGMSVKKMEALRDKVREAGGSIYVAKNTLIRVALEQTNNPVPADMLTGQTAIGFALEDGPKMAKTLIDHAKEDDLFIMRGGISGGALLSTAQVDALANLPSLDELRAQIVGMIQQPASKLVTVLSAPSRDLVTVVKNGASQLINVINAYVQKTEEAVA
jgi:large subunit ribosomal protein L10